MKNNNIIEDKMNSKEISIKYLSEKNNISKYPVDERFADSHWELKEKFDNICQIAEKIALEEFKNTRFQYASYYHIDRIKARGLIIMLCISEIQRVSEFTDDTATVSITWAKIDEILKQKK